MSDDRRAADAETIEQLLGVAGQQIEMIADVRLGRLAEAELVRHDDAIALTRQQRDRLPPIIARKALAVQQHDGLAVRRRRRCDVHIGHPHRLALDGEVEEMHRVGIVDALEADAERLERRRLGGGAADRREPNQQDGAGFRETTSHG
jgi:hypothetical protein